MKLKRYSLKYQNAALVVAVLVGIPVGAAIAQTQADPFSRNTASSPDKKDGDTLVANLQPGSPGALVANRVNKRWAHMVKHDFKSVYDFFAPASKAATSQEAYVKEMANANAWLGAEVISVKCEQPQSCIARVRIDAASPMPGKFKDKISTHVDEDWVLVDGEWWFSRR